MRRLVQRLVQKHSLPRARSLKRRVPPKGCGHLTGARRLRFRRLFRCHRRPVGRRRRKIERLQSRRGREETSRAARARCTRCLASFTAHFCIASTTPSALSCLQRPMFWRLLFPTLQRLELPLLSSPNHPQGDPSGGSRGAAKQHVPTAPSSQPHKPSLYEKLLAKDIREDRSRLLQALRFFVQQNFFIAAAAKSGAQGGGGKSQEPREEEEGVGGERAAA